MLIKFPFQFKTFDILIMKNKQEMIWHKCHIYTSIFLVWSMYWYLCRKNEMQPKDAFENESGLVTLVMPNNSHIWIDPICHILNLNRDSLKDPIDMSKKIFQNGIVLFETTFDLTVWKVTALDPKVHLTLPDAIEQRIFILLHQIIFMT